MRSKSIAVIGGSANEGAVGREVLQNVLEGGYKGSLYPVNPKFSGQTLPIAGTALQFYGKISELPDGVESAVIMTPAHTVPDIERQLGARGIRAWVVISAGFGEAGPAGKQLANELKQVAQQYGAVVIGPNCLGIANADPAVQLNATFVRRPLKPGQTAIVSQSGAVGIDLVDRAQRSGLGVAQFVSVGNSAEINALDLIQYWRKDPAVKVIAGYLESIPRPEKFMEVCRAVSAEKPICLIKAGRSSEGARAASSHTGSLAGSDQAAGALLEQSGVIRANSIQELGAMCQALECSKPSIGKRVAIYSNAGGYGVMSVDHIADLEQRELVPAELKPDTVRILSGLLPKTASSANPVDTTATVPFENLQNFKLGLMAVAGDPQVDSVLVSVVPVMGLEPAQIALAAAEVQSICPKPIVVMLPLSEAEQQGVRNAVTAAQRGPLAVFTSLEDALTGLAALEKRREFLARPAEPPRHFTDVKPEAVRAIFDKVRAEKRTLLTTTESMDVLRAYGVPVPDYALVTDEKGALAAARALGFPVVLKLCSKTVSHKTEVGGVELDLRNATQLKEAYRRMRGSLKQHGIDKFEAGEGIIVMPFLKRGREVIVGLNEDPQLGKLLMLGLGGIYVEIFKDVKFRLAPVTANDCEQMLSGLKSRKIIEGYRGKPGVDRERLSDVLQRLSQLVTDFPELREIDINPFMAQPKAAAPSTGGQAVDARMLIA